jgi:hypothetical protein
MNAEQVEVIKQVINSKKWQIRELIGNISVEDMMNTEIAIKYVGEEIPEEIGQIYMLQQEMVKLKEGLL